MANENFSRKGPKRQLQGTLSHAQGQRFEERLNVAFAYYRMKGLAVIEKTPEPMKPIKNLGNGKFISFFEKKAQADYSGTLCNGRHIVLEAKYTSKDRIEQGRVTLAQAENLVLHSSMGAWCFVIAGFSTGNVYLIPWAVWRDMKGIFGHRYVTEKELEEFKVPVVAGAPMVLDKFNK